VKDKTGPTTRGCDLDLCQPEFQFGFSRDCALPSTATGFGAYACTTAQLHAVDARGLALAWIEHNSVLDLARRSPSSIGGRRDSHCVRDGGIIILCVLRLTRLPYIYSQFFCKSQG
jgi:hypothetical protein